MFSNITKTTLKQVIDIYQSLLLIDSENNPYLISTIMVG